MMTVITGHLGSSKFGVAMVRPYDGSVVAKPEVKLVLEVAGPAGGLCPPTSVSDSSTEDSPTERTKTVPKE